MPSIVRSFYDLINSSEHNRILRLFFPNNDAPRTTFLVNKINAAETLSKDFDFIVELISDDASFPLKDMRGKLLSIGLVRLDGSMRFFSGYVFSFQRCHSDGSIAFYRARLVPWLKYLGLRKNSYIFHGKTLRDQTEKIFRDYGHYAVWDWRVADGTPVMTDAVQFNETDFNYLSRRWEAAGWYYWYEHNSNGHTLIVSSDSTTAPAIDGEPDIRFHGKGGAFEEDAIDRWSPTRNNMATDIALGSFNFKVVMPHQLTLPTLNQQGDVPKVESYEYVGSYGYRNAADGDAQCRVRLEEIEAIGKHVEAESTNRFVMPGRWFRFTSHFNHRIGIEKKDDFLILSAQHIATNNYLREEGEKILYRNSMICSRKVIRWRPGRGFNSVDTKILAPQTALVVGPTKQDNVFTDEYGRVRVQFHWDRVGNNDSRSSTWIRVSSAWAGAELGAAAIPRVGTEVIVQWLDGCPDHPLITGAVFNQRNMPPWSVPAQRALTGLRSRELTPGGGNSPAGRSNHLILDDTNGEIQAQLKSDQQHSQLSLGSITRIENSRGRTDARGSGWELRTDGHGVARAAEGMLITTESRTRAQGHVKDMDETIQRLSKAHDLHDTNATAAMQAQAQESNQQHEIVDALETQNGSIKGSGDTFPELSNPHIVFASSAGIASTGAKSTHISSNQHIALTSGGSLSIAAGESVFASIKDTLRVFVHKAGMKLVAAAGKITIQAHDDEIQIVADKVLGLISQTDWIDLKGRKGVRLHGAGSMVEISDLVQVFTSKPVQFHGNLETLGPKNKPHPSSEHKIKIDELNKSEQLIFTLQAHSQTKRPFSNVPYALFKGDIKVRDGITDDLGQISIEHVPGTSDYRVELPDGETYALKAVPEFAEEGTPDHLEQRLSNVGARALAGITDSREHD